MRKLNRSYQKNDLERIFALPKKIMIVSNLIIIYQYHFSGEGGIMSTKHILTACMLSCAFYIQPNVYRFATNETAGAYTTRLGAAYNQCYNRPAVPLILNPNITGVADYAGMFTKTLAHDPVTGIATPDGQANFEVLLQATQNGLQATYNSIAQAATNTRKFVNPQASAAWCMIGCDTASISIPMPPSLTSAWAAVDLVENYLMAIARTVQFNEYGTGIGTDADTINGGSITNNACTILNALSCYTGPKVAGSVTPAVLFRANYVGTEVGPYISQFAFLDIHRYDQPLLAVKQYMAIKGNHTYGVTWSDFVKIQDGEVPDTTNDFNGTVHYMLNGNDLGTLVHYDMLSEPYVYAQNVLFNNKFTNPSAFPLSSANPYYNGQITNQDPFATLWYPDLANLVGAVSLQGLKTAWESKWRWSLRLRPEAMAGIVHRAKTTGTNPYNINPLILGTIGGINLLDWVQAINQLQSPANPDYATYLLAQEYPEGSPVHPSYLAGHATVAGATVTIMKAFMDDTAQFNTYATPMVPDPTNPLNLIPYAGADVNLMTVGGELNKLASNIAFGRNFAGVHYRTDGDVSLQTGEQVAIAYLQDWARTYAEQGFNGFELTKFNGQRIRVLPNEIINL
jgi:hypothetical protein